MTESVPFRSVTFVVRFVLSNVDAICSALQVRNFNFLDREKEKSVVVCVCCSSIKKQEKRSLNMSVIVFRNYTGYSHGLIEI